MKLIYEDKMTRERIGNTLIGSILLLAVVYCVIVLSIVLSTIDKRQALISIKEITSQISILESQYAIEAGNIDESKLANFGFVKITDTNFTVRKDEIASLSFLYER